MSSFSSSESGDDEAEIRKVEKFVAEEEKEMEGMPVFVLSFYHCVYNSQMRNHQLQLRKRLHTKSWRK
jgi:hypothetical protein